MDGHFGRILRVDLGTGELRDELLDEEYARDYIGGSGLGVRYLWDLVGPDTDPLGPDNPLLFLTGTVLTTYTLLARLVQAQSAQIGVLRATGFSQRAILAHFLGLAVLPSLGGGLVGIGLGYLFAWWITRLYVALISIPYMFFDWRPEIAGSAFLIAPPVRRNPLEHFVSHWKLIGARIGNVARNGGISCFQYKNADRFPINRSSAFYDIHFCSSLYLYYSGD